MSSAAKQDSNAEEHPNLAAFLVDLTDLTHKHQIAVSGQPVLIVLEREDYALQYECDAEGHLTGA
jgi:hypothetical protein